MKKIFCLILTVIMALSCVPFVAHAASFTTEKGVQVEIAPFLYKSTLYQMEFPSHQSYEIKEKSNVGDYAISRELNDLSYTFIFPAGTTEIECMLSLNGENKWRGFDINYIENPSFWPKDDNGNVDFSQPLTFKRNEITAERDEYGVLYRDYLMDAGVADLKIRKKFIGDSDMSAMERHLQIILI
ncbi:MAG: hypothetical protein IJZ57_01135 [Clostridia bacterium]|nr:hypothetical protein [Clostridia bacterium]